tara:strand:- start:671 stop:856 length:186 start_codon:yes stop_codon:yes gene_type:complete
MNINLVKASATVITKRAAYYENLGTQLDKLYHDIDSGKLGDDAKTGDFYVGRKAVKDKYPK